MKLIIFDIDGTILDSVKADDECFIQTVKDLYNIDLKDVKWNNFNHVTDSGLTIEIFNTHFGRPPSIKEITVFKKHFKNLLSKRTDEFSEIVHAISFISKLSEINDFEIGFATGGWEETAELKCESVGFKLNNYLVKSASDHFNRTTIIELLIQEALQQNNLFEFESIIYFGDGLWDLKSTSELGIKFIGVDYSDNEILKKAGVKRVIKDYSESTKLLQWIS